MPGGRGRAADHKVEKWIKFRHQIEAASTSSSKKVSLSLGIRVYRFLQKNTDFLF